MSGSCSHGPFITIYKTCRLGGHAHQQQTVSVLSTAGPGWRWSAEWSCAVCRRTPERYHPPCVRWSNRNDRQLRGTGRRPHSRRHRRTHRCTNCHCPCAAGDAPYSRQTVATFSISSRQNYRRDLMFHSFNLAARLTLANANVNRKSAGSRTSVSSGIIRVGCCLFSRIPSSIELHWRWNLACWKSWTCTAPRYASTYLWYICTRLGHAW